jgi:hypothetical protein
MICKHKFFFLEHQVMRCQQDSIRRTLVHVHSTSIAAVYTSQEAMIGIIFNNPTTNKSSGQAKF